MKPQFYMLILFALTLAIPALAAETASTNLDNMDEEALMKLVEDPNFALNVPGGTNPFFKYDSACQTALKSASDGYKKTSAEWKALEELGISSEDLDRQSKIVTDRNEKDLTFRMQVMDTSAISAESVVYELEQLRKLKPSLAEKLSNTCDYGRIKIPLEWDERLKLFLLFYEGPEAQ